MRAIDVDSIIDFLKENFIHLKKLSNTLTYIDEKRVCDGQMQMIAEIRSFISHAPTIDVPEWISVKERLPKPKTGVLALLDNGEVGSLWQDWAEHPEHMTYFEVGGEEEGHVTHWMPLPEPPKEDER